MRSIAHAGTINQVMGDAIMTLFGAGRMCDRQRSAHGLHGRWPDDTPSNPHGTARRDHTRHACAGSGLSRGKLRRHSPGKRASLIELRFTNSCALVRRERALMSDRARTRLQSFFRIRSFQTHIQISVTTASSTGKRGEETGRPDEMSAACQRRLRSRQNRTVRTSTFSSGRRLLSR